MKIKGIITRLGGNGLGQPSYIWDKRWLELTTVEVLLEHTKAENTINMSELSFPFGNSKTSVMCIVKLDTMSLAKCHLALLEILGDWLIY